jgi:hypothetical protein
MPSTKPVLRMTRLRRGGAASRVSAVRARRATRRIPNSTTTQAPARIPVAVPRLIAPPWLRKVAIKNSAPTPQMSASCRPLEGCTSENFSNALRHLPKPPLTILYNGALRTLPIAVAVFSIFGSTSDSFDFDRVRPGTLPPGWSMVATRPEAAGHWEIRADSTAPSRPHVIAHVQGATADTEQSLAIFDNSVCYDGDVSVKFKILNTAPGSRTASLIWRYRDPRNFYMVRFSVDEGNIELFRVVNGEPQMVSAGSGRHDLRTGQWYVAKVVFRGDKVRVLFGNRLLFNASDTVISKPGKTGLRTRAGTTVYFDDFRIDRKG